jgi:cytochrome P450
MSATVGRAVPTSDVDPFSDAFLDDPYADHAAMRDAGAAVWLQRYGLWGIARAEHVEPALRDPDTFCSGRGVGIQDFSREKPFRPPSLLLEADPPDHTKARGVITKVLGPKAVKAMRETFRAEAEAMIEPLVERGRFDGMADLAEPYPLKVFPDQLGLEEGPERQQLILYGGLVFNAFGPHNERFRQAAERAAGTAEWIMAHTRREALRAGGLGDRVHQLAAEVGYSDDEAGMIVRSFLSAGVDTTVNGLGNTLFCLASHPDQWSALRAEPTLARAAFEEAIRHESPVQTFFRTATRDVDLGDVTVRDGDKVLLFLAAANRDPRRWGDDADHYNIRRAAAGHVGFGAGIHACVGQMLARLEGECVLSVLAERVATLALDGEPVRELNNSLRGFERLPLRVQAA